jgi:2'-5' RNA ligase
MPRTKATDALTLFDALVYTCQYRLVIDPASGILARVMEWRQAVRDKIGVFGGLYQIPGITLLETELPPDYERQLCDAISRGRTGHAPFRLHLDGFAHTEDRRTIYINVVEQAAVAALRQRIADNVRAERRIKKLGVQVAERTLLPIATGLKGSQFEAAWNLLSPHPFTGEVRVNDVVLLKRELADTSLDEHVRTFPFGPAD